VSEETNDEAFVQTFIDMMRVEMPEKVISNFVFIAEVVGSTNNELSIATSSGMTPWLAQGMLKAAEDMILTGVDTFFDDEEEDQ